MLQDETAAAEAPGPARATSLDEAAAALGRIARSLGAAEAAFFLIGPEPARLVPCLDTLFPGMSETTGLLSDHGAEVARHAGSSTVGMWWADAPCEPLASMLGSLRWAIRAPAAPCAKPGIALPVFAEAAGSGAMVFTGSGIALDDERLCRAHTACFSLFADIAGLLQEGNGKPARPVSPRELECLMLTANGHTSEQIAGMLGLSVHTANQYLANTVQKLDAVNRMHAVAKALRVGLID